MTVSGKVLMCLLLISGLLLVETTEKVKFVVAASAEYDLISRVSTSVFDDFSGHYKIGAMVRIDVFGNFPTAYFDHGTVQITSASLGYDSGVMKLTIAEDGVNYLAFWNTFGLSKANDYVVSVTLTDKSGRATTDSDTVVALSCDPVFKNILVSVTDVSFPGRGLSTNLVRSFHDRSGYNGVFGYGWTHSYNVRLIKYPDGSVRVHEGDGSNSWFQVTPSGGYTSPVYARTLCLLPTSPTGGFERKYRNGLIERFDSSGKLESITDPNGNSMTFAYDGWLLARIIDPVGHITYLGYNDKGRISSVTDPAGRMTLYEYDNFGNLVSVTDPAGGVTRYAYDSNHNLMNITDAEGRCKYFEYDVGDRLVSEYYEGGKNRLTYLYDENELSVTVEDALGHQTTYIYGENNELVGITDALGNAQCFYYDTNFSMVRFVDANGHETRFTYDDQGNVLTSCDALVGVTRFTYEERFNKVTSITDALGRKTTFNYDDKGNLKQITYPDGSEEKYVYDKFGNLLNKTDRKGQTISYLYDANGWLIKKVYPDLTSVAFTYDGKGNLIRVVDENGEISYDYDILDRNTRVRHPGNNVVKYSYDATGNRVQMIYPDGSMLKYVYDKAGQLTQIKDSQDHVIANYTYDQAARRVRRDLENGVYTTYSYDAADQLTELVNKKSNGDTISSFSYTYDPAGVCLTMTTLEGIYRYSYDANYQLVSVSYPDGSTATYSYDALGNRISMSKAGTTIVYTTNHLNQYTSISGITQVYDADGNLISDGKNTYEYDYENHLIRFTTPTEVISYNYDPFGRKISRATLVATTNYLYDGAHVIIETDGDGDLTSRYIYGLSIDEILEMWRNGRNYFYCQDGLANVVDLIDISGNLVESYGYDVYGYPDTFSSVSNPYMFAGREYEQTICLYYFRSRHYCPISGRFISQGLSIFPTEPNPYVYVSNSPVNFVDPMGWMKFSEKVIRFFASRHYAERIQPVVQVIYRAVIASAATGVFLGLYSNPVGWVISVAGAILVSSKIIEYNSQGRYGMELAEFIKYLVLKEMGWVGQWIKFGEDFVGWLRSIFRSEPSFVQSSTNLQLHEPIITKNLIAMINIPCENSLVRGSVPIFGLAYGKDFQEYRLESGEGKNPKAWIPIVVSSIPKNECATIGTFDSSADTTIFGNLGNWDTGLKEYVYLPTYPPDHPVDLNGIYTLRLVVIGRNGETVEDRVTVEVSRVISNAFGGTALSRDHKVILTVPEQSIMDSFRLISIKSVEESTVSIDSLHKLVGDIYEFREPGEKFTKTATLQMKWSNEDLQGVTPSNLGIYTYNPETQNWQYLPTERIEEENTLITTITKITQKTAYYAILASSSPSEGSTIYKPPPEKPKPQESTQNSYLFLNTFENSLDEWSNRDGEVGATLCLDNTATFDGTYCLKLTNKKRGGNFASNIRQTPFDAKKYPIVRFDYKIPSDVKINFLVKVSGRWYDIRFTDDPKEYKYKRVNMAGIGKIEGVIADNNWHTAEFNLYEMLRTKTRKHIVEEMIMADWDITGYMKLEFGHNHQGATYYIDNFSISKDPEASNTDDSSVLIIDDFNSKENINLLKGGTFTFTDNQGLGRIQKFYLNEQPFSIQDGEGYSLHLSYDVSRQNAYAGYVTILNNMDLSEYQTLTFWIKGKDGGETVLIGLRDQIGHESKLLVGRYLSHGITADWQKVTIPLTAFTNIQHWKAMENLNLCFENYINSGRGEIYVDGLRFEKILNAIVVDDFEGKNGRNLFGGSIRAFSGGNCTINMTYDNSNILEGASAYRISYRGAMGDPFTYCGFESELKGIDVSAAGRISLYIKGAIGGETPNIYLDDGTSRVCVVIGKYVTVTPAWQKVTIPLSEFSSQGVDLTHLQEFQIVFEWENMSGTIWIDNIQFEK